MRLVPEAKVEEDSSRIEEEECISGKISPMKDAIDESPKDIALDEAAAPEPEESFIHPMIMEKLNGLWGQAQAATGWAPKNSSLAGSEDSKSWLETNFDKMKTGMNTINEAGPVNDTVPVEEDARNDCAEASNPALNEEVRA